MEKIQYLRKRPKKRVTRDPETNKLLRNEDGSKVYFQPSGGKKIGLMFAESIHDEVVIGFSLVHKSDKFDYKNVNGFYMLCPGFGYSITRQRAFKWRDRYAVTYGYCDPITLKNCGIVAVPHSIKSELTKFIYRCKRYYKDKTFPKWAEAILADSKISKTTVPRMKKSSGDYRHMYTPVEPF
jgi:hypothetical protein